MSTSGSSPPPTPPKGAQSFPPSRAETAVEILQITGELRQNARATKINGTITRIQEDGTAHIKTDKGEITVKIHGRERPQEGEEIEVRLPAGKPPRKAHIAQASKQETPQQSPDKASAETYRPGRAVERRDTSPRLSEDVYRSLQKLPQESVPVREGAPLKPQDLVRLLPVTAAKLETLIQTAQIIVENNTLPPLPLSPHALAHTAPAAASETLTTTMDLTPPEAILQRLYTAPLLTHLSESPSAENKTLPLQVASPPLADSGIAFSALPQTAGESPLLQIQPSFINSGTFLDPAFKAALHATQETLLTPPPSQQAAFLHKIRTSGFVDLRVVDISPQLSLMATNTAPQNLQQSLESPAGTATTIPSNIPKGNAGDITATVIGKTAKNLPILYIGTDPSQEMFFILQAEANNLLPGTEIIFSPHIQSSAGSADGNTASLSSATQIAPFVSGAITPLWQLFGSFDWPALEQIQQSLQAAAPQMAAALSQKIPTPATPQRLPAAALFFIAAVKAGDVNNWLGNKTVETLKKLGKASSLARLNSDFLGLNKTGSEPVSQDWRALALPLNWQDHIDKTMLYYRHGQDSGQNDHERGKMTRFIFDLNLSRMGPVQLDGLHRGPRLDLIVRTHNPLSAPMKQIMRQKYTAILENCSMAGILQFQDNPDQWVIIDMKSAEQAAALNI